MLLEIITPEKSVLSEEVDEVLAPTESGQIGILPHHVNLVTQLTHGEMIVKKGGKERFIAVAGGFLEVNKDKVTILADYAEHAQDIDMDKAQQAQKRAEELLAKKKFELTPEEITIIEGELRRALLQQHIAQRHHRKSH